MEKTVQNLVLKRIRKLLLLGTILLISSITAVGQAHRVAPVDQISSLFPGVQINQDISESSILNKLISVEFQDIPLLEAINIISEKANLEVVYNSKTLQSINRTINFKSEQITLEQALWQTLDGTGLRFAVADNKQLILLKRTFEEEKVIDAFRETVTGQITDGDTGEPLPGVNIVILGTTNGTSSDIDGSYSLSVESLQDTLEFSFLGYQTQRVPINGRTTVNVTMQPQVIEGDELVVVGYSQQRAEDLTGSVSRVQGAEIKKAPVTNVSQGLAGRLPGVVAISNTGEPGYDGATIRIRGLNTFGNANPLVVVDGVPGRSLDRIDPSTVESISVLKDASAAIYGAQAANGVILITTKRGTSGKPTINFSYNQGFARPTTVPDMANSAQYATLLNEIDMYAGNPMRYTSEEIETFRDGSDPWNYPNTDWFDETLKPWSPQYNGNLSIDGGTENLKYFVSGSTKGQDGFYENSATNYNQYDLRSNLDFKVNDHIDLTFNASGRYEDRNYPVRSAENIFRMLMRSKPNMPAYWPNGLPGPDIEYGDNPVVISTDATGYNEDRRYIVNSDFGIDVEIPWVDGLSVEANASLDKYIRFQKVWQTPWYLYNWDGQTVDENGEPVLVRGKKGFDDPRLAENMEDSHNILLSGLVNYEKTIANDHKINLLGGVERITANGDLFDAYRRYYISTAIDQLFAGGRDEMNNGGSGWEQARLNYFGRVNYRFKNRYLAEFVWRYQASYIFEESSRYGFFPGVSLGYLISEENFWKDNISIVNFAKIRASIGETGNDLIAPYQFLASYQFNDLSFITDGGNSFNKALMEGVAPNRGVTWETAIQRNVGIDLEFFDGQLALTTDYFYNTRDDILWARNASVPFTAGLDLPDENIGRVRNQGVDFSLEYTQEQSTGLSYSIGVNGVYAKNKILFWDEPPGGPEYQQSTGRPIGSDLYYRAIGVFQDQEHVNSYPHWDGARPGDIIFEDYNNDGVIDANDRVRDDRSRTPTFTGGVNLAMAYKGFDLSVLFQGAAGGVFYQSTESGDFGNFLESFYEERWTAENPSSKHPRTYNRSGVYWVNQANTYWLHKTDYIRLKNIELGYTLPVNFTSAYGIQDVRLYLSAFNLFTFSPDMKDFDPETVNDRAAAGYNYPLNQVVNFGVSLTF
ncbi:SusC/RagA family TonB-linked outer membrane protein [Gracilimonas mengyeensis]|uniref:TonB-linked outer membrane protein, SusC/RagA family n=1 Tax=Gracilimonas mengyeensis TaxID=1302730 RepID=A0A521B2F8_9BACT|nr:SusC/RagA family TonB-linked outer membrane protein [Gracilimonas mengyeensis]SMO40960.1 TonB-linked outer membrane protein, SusC/RagA family [Gracilimonas mengyeensis]